jgi:hypothetical protein
MKNFHTSTLERNKKFDSDFCTHPYECGWASEAIFFVDITELNGTSPQIFFKVQISADGLNWINEGAELETKEKGLNFIKIGHFGGWLRLKAEVKGSGVSLETTIHLVLKG